MHAQRVTAATLGTVVLSALSAGLLLFAGPALGFSGGLKLHPDASRFSTTGYAVRLFSVRDDTEATGLRRPSPDGSHYGQGLLMTEVQAGALERVEPMEKGFYFSGSRPTLRQGLYASESFFGIHSRISPAWAYQVQTGITRSGAIAPAYSVSARFLTTLSSGWDLSLGLRYDMRDITDPGSHSYSGDGLGMAGAGYFPPAPPLQLAANGGFSHRLQLSYRYGARNNSLGLTYSSGRYPDDLFARGLALDDTRQFSLTGSHWLSQDWALNYGIAPGDINRRQGLHLGLRYLF